MNITLAPLGLRLGSHPVVNNQLQAGSSMMVVGDAAHVGYPGSDVTATEEDLALELNRVNFISNQARGSNGADFGGGGGGGAGGAIFLIDGELVINQSVFQSLRADGGDGSRRARGGQGCVDENGNNPSPRRHAEKGGDGGYFSTPLLRINEEGELSWPQSNAGGSAGRMGGVSQSKSSSRDMNDVYYLGESGGLLIAIWMERTKMVSAHCLALEVAAAEPAEVVVAT